MPPKNRTSYHDEFDNAPRANNDDPRVIPSIALGIIGLIGTVFMPIITLIVGAIATTLGIGAMRAIVRSDFEKTGYGTARIGACLGALTLVLSLSFIIYAFAK